TRRSTAHLKSCCPKFRSRRRNTNTCWPSSSIRLTTTTKWSPELEWDRAIRNKRIVYMFMGSMIVKETAYAIGMLALQDLLNFIGRAYAYEQAKTPVRLTVDEVGRLVFPGFDDL